MIHSVWYFADLLVQVLATEAAKDDKNDELSPGLILGIVVLVVILLVGLKMKFYWFSFTSM